MRPPVRQNAFVPGRALARADGSLVLPGATGVVEHTDRGPTNSLSEAAVAATTPAFALDPAFGGAARPPTIAVRVAPERLGDRRRRDRADLGAQACACCA